MAHTTEAYIRIDADGKAELVETSVKAISHTSLLSQLANTKAPSDVAITMPGFKPNTTVVHNVQTGRTHYYEIWNTVGITGRWGISDAAEIKTSLSPTWQMDGLSQASGLAGFPIEDEFAFQLPNLGQFMFHVCYNPISGEATSCLYATVPNSSKLFHPLIPNVWGSAGSPPGALCFGDVRAPSMSKFMGFEAYCASVYQTWHAGENNHDLFETISLTVPDELYHFDVKTKTQVPFTFSWNWDQQGTIVREKTQWEMEITNASA